MVSVEYARELEDRLRLTMRSKQAELVVELLKGESLNATELEYDLDGWHTAVIASGSGAAKVIRRLAGPLDYRLFLVEPEPNFAWAWFGGREKLDPADLISRAPISEWDAVVAVGEPGVGRSGWRLSHEQAEAALAVALRGSCSVARYAHVGLVGAVGRNRLLVDSLEAIYLVPLSTGRGKGESLKETLRAYFSTGRNLSSAAAMLHINRQTVKNRLALAEEKLGLRIEECALELELALRLEHWQSGAT
jgi:hypothetical protein